MNFDQHKQQKTSYRQTNTFTFMKNLTTTRTTHVS